MAIFETIQQYANKFALNFLKVELPTNYSLTNYHV